MSMRGIAQLICVLITLSVFQAKPVAAKEICRLKSPDGINVLSVSLDNHGQLLYCIDRKGHKFIDNSPLGLVCDDEDFSKGMVLHKVGPEVSRHEQYQLLVGNKLSIDSNLIRKQLTFKNQKDSFVIIDLAASNEGFGFRYRFEGDEKAPRTVVDELTGFHVPKAATAWLQPYHTASLYTPAYEDFFYCVAPGEAPPVSRAKPRGWCLPGLFKVSSGQGWMLIAEAGTDGSYCACHLDADKQLKGMYKIAFAFEDEVTKAKSFNANSSHVSVLTRRTPWRVVVMGDGAGDILNSTLVTDLATPSQIKDTSWIKTGRASWSWWSHPKGPDTKALYNSFTDLATEFGWEYTLFDAGWWDAGLESISRYATNKGVRPLVWMHASDFYDAEKRRRRLDDMVSKGVKGIKVDFWCSDRQETMAAIHATLNDAAQRKLVVNLHGCTIPRGWHRTWPNLLTAEAVLGTESYFYESRYPEKTAEQNTILPFTRNVLAPMDTTPVALTIRKYPRKTTAVHELATAIVFTSGIINYADSVEVFDGLPDEVKQVLTDVPSGWDETKCLVGDPGRMIVLARRMGEKWFIAGLNGTDKPQPVSLSLKPFGQARKCVVITEGEDPLMQFSVKEIIPSDKWDTVVRPFGGFVLHFKPEK